MRQWTICVGRFWASVGRGKKPPTVTHSQDQHMLPFLAGLGSGGGSPKHHLVHVHCPQSPTTYAPPTGLGF